MLVEGAARIRETIDNAVEFALPGIRDFPVLAPEAYIGLPVKLYA